MKTKLIFVFLLAFCLAFVSNSFASTGKITYECGFTDDAYVYLDTVTVVDISKSRIVIVSDFNIGSFGVKCIAYKTKAFFSNGTFYCDVMDNPYICDDEAQTEIDDAATDNIFYAQKGDTVIIKIRVTAKCREVVGFEKILARHENEKTLL